MGHSLNPLVRGRGLSRNLFRAGPLPYGSRLGWRFLQSRDRKGAVVRASLLQNLAGLGLSDQTVCIVLEKVPSTHQPFGSKAHLRDVLLSIRERVVLASILDVPVGEADKVKPGVTAVTLPVRETVCGLPVALSVRVSVAVSVVDMEGV